MIGTITPAGETHFIKQLQRISGLVGDTPSRMFLTASHWGQVADEIKRQYPSALANPAGLPTPANFKALKIGALTVLNSGTDDDDVVNLMNEEDAKRANFAWKRDNLITGKNNTPEA